MYEKPITLTTCDKEPIHIPGAIQPHGFLVAVTEPDFIIKHISNNVVLLFNKLPKDVISKRLDTLIDEHQLSILTKNLIATSLQKNIQPECFQLRLTLGTQLFDLNLHRSEGLLIIEMEPSEIRPENYINFIFDESKRLVENLQNINDLSELFQATVDKVRRLTGFDRVMIYQFNKEGDGSVIAESKEQGLATYLGLHYPASDIPQQARRLYTLNWLRFIPNVNYTPSPITSEQSPTTGQKLDLSFSVLRSVSPIHIEYLKNMKVQASMSISIIVDGQLWGLIACHHNSPKFLPYELRIICKLVGQTLSWKTAILQQIHHQEQFALRKDFCNALLKSISDRENWIEGILLKPDSLLGLTDATGAAVCCKNQFYLIGRTPPLETIKELINRTPSCINEPIFSTNNIANFYPEAKSIKDTASGMLIKTIIKGSNIFIMWFRPELLQTIHWAGDPNKAIMISALGEQLGPRKSFALFKEKVSLHSQPWTIVDFQICREFNKYLLEIIVTQQTKRAEVAEQLIKKLEDFVNTICHEIRNPLSGIMASLDVMRSHLKEIEREFSAKTIEPSPFFMQQLKSIKTYIAHIESCAKYQTTIADDVLNLSKLKENKLMLQEVSTSFNTVINTAFNMIKSKFIEKKLHFNFIKPKIELLAKNDPHRLLQIILNLLTNAIKFTPIGGTITISLQKIETGTGPRIKIKVNDTGIGMTPEEVSRIFDRFSQANMSISSEYGGTGLGLVISRNLVNLMKGAIKVKSTKGVGTTFTVSLPYISLTEVEAKDFKAPQAEISLPSEVNAPLKILIVDDNQLNQLLLQKIIEGYNPKFKNQIASDGKEAVSLFSKESFDLIFMDIEMPVMNGLEATKEIRLQEKQRGLTPTTIVGISGNVSKKNIKEALASGMTDYIIKPVQKTKIIAIIKKWQDTNAILMPPSKLKDIEKAEVSPAAAASPISTEHSATQFELAAPKILYLKKKIPPALKNIPSLKYQPIPGDGHCLYHAVSLYTSEGDQLLLRNIVSSHLEHNLEEFREFIDLPKGKTINNYIQDVSGGKEWASHIEIEILMRVLNRPILVILPDGHIQNQEDLKRFKGEPIFVFYNKHNYDALLRKKEYSTQQVIDQLMQLNISQKKPDFDQELSNILSHAQGDLNEAELTNLHKQFQALGEQALALQREDFFLQRGKFYEKKGLKKTNTTQKNALLSFALKDYQTTLELNPFSSKAAEKIEALKSAMQQTTAIHDPQFFTASSAHTSSNPA